jgi:excisionase family DNA binding protein
LTVHIKAVKMSNPFEVLEQKLDTIEGLIKGLKDTPQTKQVSYLTREQAAEILHITLPTLATYTREGIIRGHRIGTRVLYTEEAIHEAVKEVPALRYKRR